MAVMALIILLAATLGRIAIRRCPLARAIGRQIDQIAASSSR